MRGDATLLGDARSEIRLDLLLDEMLATRGREGRRRSVGAADSIIELRDIARRLRAASHWTPLPEGRLNVRQALLVAARQGAKLTSAGRGAWRRAGVWLSGTAIVAILSVWSFSAGTSDRELLSGVARAFRVLLQKPPAAVAPHPARYALDYDLPAIRIPEGTGTIRIQGRVGGLPVTVSLTRATGTCAPGTACGTFTIASAQLKDAASVNFGMVAGTFGCGADGTCTFAFAKMTGVFATIEESTLSAGANGQRHGRLATALRSLNDWVSTVASAGQKLQADGLLPAGLTIKDLTTAAGANGTAHQGNDATPVSSPSGSGAGPGPGAGAVGRAPGAGLSGRGDSHLTGHREAHSSPAGPGRVHKEETTGRATGNGSGASHSAASSGGQTNGASPRGRPGPNGTRGQDPDSTTVSSQGDYRAPLDPAPRQVTPDKRIGSDVYDSGHHAGGRAGDSPRGGDSDGRATSSHDSDGIGSDKAAGDKDNGGKGSGDTSGSDTGGGNGDGSKGGGDTGGGGKGGRGK